MKQFRNISLVILVGAISLGPAAAQERPKRGEGRGAQRTERVQQDQDTQQNPQQNTQPSNVQPQATQSSGAPAQGTPRNQFLRPTNRPPADRRRDGQRNRPLHPFGARAGDWLRQYRDVPVDQQEKALTNDPNFQRLPTERQDRLRERLRQFNNMPPEKQDQLLDRMEKFETLPPEQRQRLRSMQERMNQLPTDRQQHVRRAFHALKGMSAEQRQNFFGSDRFRNQFNDDERDILRGLIEIEGTPELAEPPDPRLHD